MMNPREGVWDRAFPQHPFPQASGLSSGALGVKPKHRLTQEGGGWKGPVEEAHLEQVAQDNVPLGFEHRQGRRLRKLPGQPVLVFDHLDRKKLFSHVQLEHIMCFNLCLLPLVLSVGTLEESLAPSSSFPPSRDR